MGAKQGKDGLGKNDNNVILETQMDMLLKHTHFTREEIIEQHQKYQVGFVQKKS